MAAANLELSVKLVHFLKEAGVEQVVLCSGSRNAPLVFSLQANNFECFHHVDERAAAFFALGLAMKERNPIAVVCTSGTAVAEMLPATIEAYYQKLPLILVTADRPENFRGTAAPQAIEQVGIYSHYAECFDVQGLSDFPEKFSYPLQLNICLEEPAAGDWCHDLQSVGGTHVLGQPDQVGGSPLPISQVGQEAIHSFINEADSIVVTVASLSPAEGKIVSKFLEKLKAPVLADTTSNLCDRALPYVLRCGEKLLRKHIPTRVLRLGSVPYFRFWRDLEKNSIEVLSYSREGFSGLGRASQFTSGPYEALLELEIEAKKQDSLFVEDKILSEKLDALLEKYPESELAYWKRLAKFISPTSLLYLGNSLPIREWNMVNGIHANTFANRGANGIDGQVSTYLGLADSSKESWACVGDQTALYDLNALAIANQKGKKVPKSKRRIVVMNNGGGKIFSHLNYSHTLEAHQRKVIENQHRWEFRGWAEMFGWAYESWQEGSGVLNTNCDDLILEIFPNASQTFHFWNEWRNV